jgi:hypothetical protein
MPAQTAVRPTALGPRRLEARTVWLWALANSVAGLGIGAAIRLFAGGDVVSRALVPMSVVFANVVGFAAMLTVRFVLPRYSGFPTSVRIPLAVVSLIAGGVFGSAVAILINPLIVFYQMRYALMIVTVNGVLALAVGLVTYTYEQMRRQIEAAAVVRARFEQEMSLAREIQMDLLPKTYPKIPGLDIFGFTVPARHVGGDCYDVIDLDHGKLAITIGDVSGKGTPAAILMANVQASVRALSETGMPAGTLMERVNRIVCASTDDDVFITFFYCVLDSLTGALTYVNAGHNPPFILRADGTKQELTDGGLIIGVVPGARYEEGFAALGPGDGLVLFTDGVTEATNASDEMYGEDRLDEVITRHRGRTAREIEERVYTSVTSFADGAAQADDLTMVVVKIAGGTTVADPSGGSDSPQEAKGGSSAARGVPHRGTLRGPAEANPLAVL